MMRIIIALLGCIFLSDFVYARVDYTTLAALNHSSYPHLTDTNQSQTFEPMSSIEHFPKIASVHFIVSDNRQIFDDPVDMDYNDPTEGYCERYGFTITSCSSGLFNQSCPYNGSIYDRCCEADFIYTQATCIYPRTLGSEVCGGKSRCYCDSAAYPYDVCNSPQIKGDACVDDTGSHYSSCVCPEDNNGQWGCKEYYPSPCGHVCKTPYPDNCHVRDPISLPSNSYCSEYWYDCSSKCRYYSCFPGDVDISSCPWMRCWVKL